MRLPDAAVLFFFPKLHLFWNKQKFVNVWVPLFLQPAKCSFKFKVAKKIWLQKHVNPRKVPLSWSFVQPPQKICGLSQVFSDFYVWLSFICCLTGWECTIFTFGKLKLPIAQLCHQCKQAGQVDKELRNVNPQHHLNGTTQAQPTFQTHFKTKLTQRQMNETPDLSNNRALSTNCWRTSFSLMHLPPLHPLSSKFQAKFGGECFAREPFEDLHL